MTDFEIYANHCRRLIPEGITLLEHDGALPLRDGEKIALFGRGQFEYIKSGTGSGGRVNCPYVTNISNELSKRVTLDSEVLEFFLEYIKENPFDNGNGWTIPNSQKQPILEEEFVANAAKRQDKAIFVICRLVGEGRDCSATRGCWYLSEEEEQNIAILAKHFKHLIVLINSGNIIDMSWVKKYNVGTVAYVWQGGQEGGTGTADALMGDIAPSGRLADTIARSIEDYPSANNFGAPKENIHVEDIYVGYRYFETFAKDKVLYPFGYGLGYTSFVFNDVKAQKDGDTVKLSVTVKNIGEYAGREVVQVYYSAPCGALGKPARELAAFKKTKTLSPKEEQTVDITLNIRDFASYDDNGASGFAYAYVLEAGEYGIYVGKNVRVAQKALSFTQEKTRLIKQCTQALAPVQKFKRMSAKNGELSFEDAPTAAYDILERIKSALPASIEITGDRQIVLKDVKEGKYSLDEFIAQFSADELMNIVRGEGMSSPKAPVPGTASCFAGVTKAWNEKGVPVVTTCDGPSGVRMESAAMATCIPVGTLLACTWDPEALGILFESFADEMIKYDVDVILAPGINIHRNPLCGRSFEYFSEDPLLTGSFAAKIAERFTKKGVYCTIKHFAVNSQETDRKYDNEVLSERALREIYLRGFEIAVKSGYVKSIMTSYNLINGFSAGACYDLTTTILRNEWGYDSFVMTDWWPMIKDLHNSSFEGNNLAEMVKAQNDVFMCVPDAITAQDDLAAAFEEGYLTLGELQRCAKNLVRFSMETLAFRMDRKSDVESLSSYNKVVFEASLADEPSLVYKLPENRWGEIPRKKLEPVLPQKGFYCAELIYKIDGDTLEQHNITIYVDSNRPMLMTVSGTDGMPNSLRFKMYLKENSTLYFEGEEFLAFKLYEM